MSIEPPRPRGDVPGSSRRCAAARPTTRSRRSSRSSPSKRRRRGARRIRVSPEHLLDARARGAARHRDRRTTLCVLIGGIDFSIAAWIGMGAIMLVQLNGSRGWSFGATFVLIAVLAIAGGGTVGYICHRWRIDPLIITLAMGAIVNGALLVWAKGFITGTPPTWLQTLDVARKHDVRDRLPAARRGVGGARDRDRGLPPADAVGTTAVCNRREHARGRDGARADATRLDGRLRVQRARRGGHGNPARRLRRCRRHLARHELPVAGPHGRDRRRHRVRGAGRLLAHGPREPAPDRARHAA